MIDYALWCLLYLDSVQRKVLAFADACVALNARWCLRDNSLVRYGTASSCKDPSPISLC